MYVKFDNNVGHFSLIEEGDFKIVSFISFLSTPYIIYTGHRVHISHLIPLDLFLICEKIKKL